MKYLSIIILLVISSLGASQGIWGDLGVPTVLKLKNATLTGYLSGDSLATEHLVSTITAELHAGAYLADDDSLLVYSDKYAFYIRQDSAGPGDRDIIIILVEEDGTEHKIEWDDGNSRLKINEDLSIVANTFTFGHLSTTANVSTFSIARRLNIGNDSKDSIVVQATDSLIVLGYSELSEVNITQAGDAVSIGAWTRHIDIPAGSATLGPTAPTLVSYGTAGALAFDADAEQVFFSEHVPEDWDGASDICLLVSWTNEEGDNIADGETVIWLSSYRSIIWGTEDIENGTAVSPSTTYTQSGAGVDGDTHETCIILDYDHADQPLTASDMLILQTSRDMTNDTYAGDGLVIKWELQYTSIGLPDH